MTSGLGGRHHRPGTQSKREPSPDTDIDTGPYWQGERVGELRLQRCDTCGATVFHPRVVCPRCFGGELHWFTAAGTGTVYSYTVTRRAGEFTGEALVTRALVDLDAGVRVLARIVGADPAIVRIGMRVQMEVTEVGDGDLPCFRPAQAPVEEAPAEEAPVEEA
jgi:uncharacterized OB-fold protein